MDRNKKIAVGIGLVALGGGLGIWALTRKAEAAPPPGYANLYGQVKDSQTGLALEGVNVSLDSQLAMTDSSGSYGFTDIPTGTYTLLFSKDGYSSEITTITLFEGNNELDVHLTPTGPPTHPGNFVYSDEFLDLRYYSEIYPEAGTNTIYAVYRCTITNQGEQIGTRTVSFYYQIYSLYYQQWYDPIFIKKVNLVLEPYESYEFVFDPRINPNNLWLGGRDSQDFYFFLLDNYGGESEHIGAH